MRNRRVMLSAVMAALLPVLSAGAEFEWQKASPESQGMSAEKLDALRMAIEKSTRAFLVVRNDRVVYEWYADGQTASSKQGTASLAKAIVGGLSLAVAMNDGAIQLDDPASKFVPQWKDGPARSKITVRHLGSHTSGIDDSHNREERSRGIDQGKYTGWAGEFWRWRQGEQRPPHDAFSISRDIAPMLFKPGTDFQYSNPGLAMLGYCVTAALHNGPHRDIRTLLRERVMRPIGVGDKEWSCGYGLTEEVDGLPLVANWGGGSYTPRAVARIGRLVLREGDWDGTRILTKAAVQHMTQDAGLPGHCGMGWWTNGDGRLAGVPRDAVWGAGAGHQILLVVPSLKLIAVRNGTDLFSRNGSNDRIGDALFAPLISAIVTAGKSDGNPGTAPYPRSPAIDGIEFDFSTHKRSAMGSDNWPLTWADDGNQYAAWGDGGGFGGSNRDGRVTLGVARISGDGENYVGMNVWGGKDSENPAEFDGKSYGILSVDGVLYMWVASQPAKHLNSCRIAWSKDHGAHWELADWSFRYEDGLSIPTFLNFGRDYQGARDEFVYSYFIHPTWGPDASATGNYGFDVHRPGKIYLARTPKSRLLHRDAFEFFAGLGANEEPTWSRDVSDKTAVFEDQQGVGWNVSASFSSSSNRYLLCTEHTATHVGNLGIFDAPQPWGPWSTVAYEQGWGEGSIEASAFYWSFPNRWLHDDGRFTMVFTGKNSNDAWNTVQGRFLLASTPAAAKSGPPVPRSDMIEGVEWAPPDTVIRLAKGSDNWPITWADDGRLYTAYGDGWGFEPMVEKKLSLGLARIAGDPPRVEGSNIRSDDAERIGQGADGVKASGMLMVDGTLYMLVRNAGNSQLAWSNDHGKSWTWAKWKFTMSFGCPTFLNFGRNYEGARDEFVYVYSHDSDSAYKPADRMVLARVPRQRLTERSAYEFFTHVDEEGGPHWSRNITDRGAVFTHPGRCYRTGVTYNAALKRYLWCQVLPESENAQGPRFQGGFGIYDSPEPWGPWTTAYFTNGWDMGPGETSSLPTKWHSDDGRTVHLVFSGDDFFSVRRAVFKIRPSTRSSEK